MGWVAIVYKSDYWLAPCSVHRLIFQPDIIEAYFDDIAARWGLFSSGLAEQIAQLSPFFRAFEQKHTHSTDAECCGCHV